MNDLKHQELQNNFQNNFALSLLEAEILNGLTELPGESYYVGGAVRDACNNQKPKDVDFSTTIDIEVMIEKFTSNGYRCKKSKTSNTLFLAKVKDLAKVKENFEISILKNGTLLQDALQRDFTINAGYVDIKTGTLIDPTGEFVNDLLEKKLVFIGEIESNIRNYPVRILRFMRFISKGFIPDKTDLKYVRKNWDMYMLDISSELVRLEIEKMNGLI